MGTSVSPSTYSSPSSGKRGLEVATITVYDPSTGQDIRLVPFIRKGVTYYRQVPEEAYNLAKSSPRRLEAVAAFSQAASAAYGEHHTAEGPPTNRTVRDLMPKLMRNAPDEGLTEADLKQQHYRALLTQEEQAQLEDLARTHTRVRLRRPAPTTPIAVTERPLPALREMRTPPGY